LRLARLDPVLLGIVGGIAIARRLVEGVVVEGAVMRFVVWG
jgi:hypothetical protein